MLNFTIGPVQSCEKVLEIGSQQVPYFRTAEFSSIMKENEFYMKKFAKASDEARAVFLTGSGTAAMEAAVINTLSHEDKVIIVNGGSFGQRFVDICTIHGIPFSEIKLNVGESLKAEHLQKYDGANHTAFLVNVHETSTGVHYDMSLISRFCQRNQLFLIVDAISSFMADEFNMELYGVDVMITSSQKALACPPGISILVLSTKALNKIEKSHSHCFYLDLKSALLNAERGQTPFTPAVGTLLQIHARLKEVANNGGVDSEISKVAGLAQYFRNAIKDLSLEIVSESLSNAVTPLHPVNNVSANEVFLHLKDEYGIWICPNGGDLKDVVFRVGHIGNLTTKDFDVLISALFDLQKRGLL